MSICMFILIANSLESQIAMGLLALIFEISKMTDLSNMTNKTPGKYLYLVSYIFKAILSIIASVGLILTLLSAQEVINNQNKDFTTQSMSIYDDEVNYWEKEILKIDDTIKLINENIQRLPDGYGKAGTSFVNQIKGLQIKKEEYREKYSVALVRRIEKLSKLSNTEIKANPSDIFEELSYLTGIDSRFMKSVIFISIMVLLEISLALITINLGVNKLDPSNGKQNNIFDTVKLSSKALSYSLRIAYKQSQREENNLHLLTQKELSASFKTSQATISNIIRRYIKPLIKAYNFESYTKLYIYLKGIK